MAQSVSNDALWEKLSEIEKKIEMQKMSASTQEQTDISSELKVNKNEIITKIKEQAKLLCMHDDSNYAAINQNIGMVREVVEKVWNIVVRIRKQQRESVEHIETQKENTIAYFNFRFFKVRKTSLVIAILGLLVFILTLFSMKQQNDYSLLLDRYYRQGIVISEMQMEIDSVKNK